MKYLLPVFLLSMTACGNSSGELLTTSEVASVKQEIIGSYEKHVEDLKNLDYKKAMNFYSNEKDEIIFGDGAYWGSYKTIDEIWKTFCMKDVRSVLRWDLKNQHVYVFTPKAASYLVEFEIDRIQTSGDTIRATGCFSYGMKKFNDGWKAVTVHVTNH